MTEKNISVWVFNGNKNKFPCGVFSSKEIALQAIEKYGLIGTLTQMPLDMLAYEWAIANSTYKPKGDHHRTPEYISNFSNGCPEHWHFGPED